MSDTPTPRTDAIAHQGLGSVAYIAEMTDFAREMERDLAEVTQSLAFQTQLNREVIEREKQTHAEIAVWKHEAKRLEAELEKFDEKAISWWCEYQDLKAKAGDDRAEIEQIKATLANPHAVHLNMMRGTIKWTPANLKSLLGDSDQ